MYKTTTVASLVPNPFRRLDEYPIQREKVDALRESIRSTGFWGNIIARPNGKKFEIAYGHHRLVAMQEELGTRAKIEVIVKNLTNEQMIQIMARENLEEWQSNAWVELETVRSTIAAYGGGEIELSAVPKDTPKGNIRNVSKDSLTRPFTKSTVAQFLGWTSKAHGGKTVQPDFKCKVAFDALDAIDAGLLKEETIKGLSRVAMKETVDGLLAIHRANLRQATAQREDAERRERRAAEETDAKTKRRLERQAEVMRVQAQMAEKKSTTEAKAFAKEATAGLRNGQKSVRDITRMAQERKPGPARQSAPNIDGLAQKTGALLDRFGDGDDQLSANMAAIKQFIDELSPKAAASLDKSFERTIKRLEKLRLVTASMV